MNVRIRRWSLGVFVAGIFALLLAWPDATLGQSKIYSTGFEPPTFQAGDYLLGTDGWSLAIPPFLNPAAATITDAVKKSGRQSVEVWGGDLASAEETLPFYEAVGSYRRPVNFSVSPDKPIVIVEADLLLETDEAATDNDFFSLTIAARSGDGETLGEMGLSSAGSVDVYGFDAGPGDPTVFSTPTALNRWHRLSLVIDFSGEKTTVAYLLGGELIYIDDIDGSTSKVLLRGSMVVYARPEGGGDTRANYTAHFDNFRISVHGADE